METEDIMLIASELGELIKENDTVKEFFRLQGLFENDRKSQELLTTLIQVGAELSEKGARGEEIKLEEKAEYRFLEEEMEKNELVKEFILAQKNYFRLLKDIQEAMRNQLKY
ncbi:MAG: YlbF family regulator [Spirochaetes bacterium]|nr:YlbF family regulator [Spirochaetota bacterium]